MANRDQEIIERVAQGDKAAYTEVVDRHKDRAMTLALRMMKNREDAEEAVQDAFVRAYHALGSFEWRSSFSTWFYRIVFNVCSTALARRHPEILVSIDGDDSLAGSQLVGTEPLPNERSESSEFHTIVAEEIDKLPPSYAGVVTLFYVQEMTYDEIVAVTGMPLGTVKAKLFRGRTMLQKAVLGRFQERQPGIGPAVMPAVVR
ncbi:MAG: sigma-70 family RNA polymerase sigma factor [Ignavibacteriales bacterium]|nr:sigma-70 family RNA polymerase sigma factor [Ignavibacteriales bacterium]